MADLFGGQGIDTTKVQDGDALPEGEYVVRITQSEVKATKDGFGSYLNLLLKVDEGPFAGRTWFEMVTLQNKNATAVNIGQQALKRLVKATGAPAHLTDSNQLHNIPFIAVTKIEADSFGDKTRMKSCKPYGNPQPQPGPASQPQQQAPTQHQAAPQTQQQAPQPGGGMPWNT